MFKKTEKEITREEYEIINAVHSLIHKGKIPYSKLEPLVTEYSILIDDQIKKEREINQQYRISEVKKTIEHYKRDIELIKQKIYEANMPIVQYNAELIEREKDLKNMEAEIEFIRRRNKDESK